MPVSVREKRGAEKNTRTIIMMPSEFVEIARAFSSRAQGRGGAD